MGALCADRGREMVLHVADRHPARIESLMITSSKPPNRREPLGISRGIATRHDRGTSSGTSPTWDASVLDAVPLRSSGKQPRLRGALLIAKMVGQLSLQPPESRLDQAGMNPAGNSRSPTADVRDSDV